MRHLSVLGLVWFVCGAAVAAPCTTYIPDPAAFPLSVSSSGSAHIIITTPGGGVFSFDPSFTRPIFFPSPLDSANFVLGGNGQSLFTACNGDFPPFSGSNTGQFGIFSIDMSLSASGGTSGLLHIVTEGTNNQPANDGNPCTAAAPCIFDNIHFVNIFDYEIAAGAYTIMTTTDRQSQWIEPGTGNRYDTTANDTGTASGFVPVLQVVPEPATLALLGLGLAGIGFTRRRTLN